MGRKNELLKLVSVISHVANSAEWVGPDIAPAAAAYCAGIYNRVLERLSKDDEDVAAVFEALPLDSPSAVVVTACRLLAACYEAAPGAAPDAEPRSAPEFAFEAPDAFEEPVPFRDF